METYDVTITKTNLGTAGTYGNVVKINVAKTYDSNDPFPSVNSSLFIEISETGDGIILASDQ